MDSCHYVFEIPHTVNPIIKGVRISFVKSIYVYKQKASAEG